MSKHYARRLARRLLILLVLAAAFTATASGPSARQVKAYDTYYEECMARCVDAWDACLGDWPSDARVDVCRERYEMCTITC